MPGDGWFGTPIEPRRTTYVKGRTSPTRPLAQDELVGWLSAWQKGPDGWYGMVNYRYPMQGWE